jgi:3-methyl-2-oxobutanoate hydroxymethyltransferase
VKTTTHTLKEMKVSGKKITVLTAYDCPTARLLDESGVDIVLVGDSVGNVLLGYENTIPVTMDEMLHHTKAASRGVKNAMIIADMPFMSYQLSLESALYNASRFIKEAGAHGVKIEGDIYIDAIKKIIEAGIPVMGHLGLTPQLINQIGGYRVQGRNADEAKMIIEGAKKLEKAGCFSIVLEMVPSLLAQKVAKTLTIPVIGIGAGVDCDGQVLVTNDILGLSGKPVPRFVKKYADLYPEMKRAVSSFISDVKAGNFPGEEQSF